jgi:O-antigen ligase
MIWSGVYALAGILIFVRLPTVLRALPALGALWVLLLLAPLSLTWSFAPDVSLRRSVALLGSSIFAVYLGTRFSRAELFRVLFWTLAATAVLSFVIGQLRPDFQWQGAFGSKNLLGRTMAMAATVALLYAMAYSRTWGTVVFVLAAGLLVQSGSKGALLVFLAGLTLLPVIRVWRMRHGVAINAVFSGVAVCGMLATWVAGNSDAVINLLGRDATLTGRIPLWGLVWDAIQLRPWLGYGYGGFWLQWAPPSGEIWRTSLQTGGWLPPNAHNGFIDLWADLGLVGLGLFLVSLAATLIRALRLAHQHVSADDMFPLLFLYFLVLSNLTESGLVTHNSLLWMWYVALSMQLRLDPRIWTPVPIGPSNRGSLDTARSRLGHGWA